MCSSHDRISVCAGTTVGSLVSPFHGGDEAAPSSLLAREMQWRTHTVRGWVIELE